jgi:hypothetical protein
MLEGPWQVISPAVLHPAAQALDGLVGGQAEADERDGKLQANGRLW